MLNRKPGTGQGRAVADETLAERLFDLIPDGMTIWEADDDEELAYFADRDLRWWMKALGHDRKHTACCTSCGCCVTCIAQMFHGAMVASVIRELNKLGALREPAALPEETTTDG